MNPEIFRRVHKDHPLLDLDSKKSLDQIGLRVNPQDLHKLKLLTNLDGNLTSSRGGVYELNF